MDDASLDDFLDAGDESETSEESSDAASEDADSVDADSDDADTSVQEDAMADDVATEDGAEGDDPSTDDTTVDAVEPARSTMTFSPDPGECEACGESSNRRWTDGEDLVCRECKEW